MGFSCTRCGALASAGARFCAACGAPLSAAEGGERKLATMVFADLVGSTEVIVARDPEDARRVLQPFFELARTTLEEHGGRVEKFIGDAVVAAFGVPRAHGDDPDRAIAAASALVERLAAGGDDLRLRVGIETGEVLVSPSGGDLALTGEPAHAAARLQAAASPGEILVGPRAARACRAATLDGPHAVGAKGFPEPLEAWRVAGRGPSTDATTPFIGRGGELETLRLAYRRTIREREPRLALVAGDAGLGKTRLVRELLSELEREELTPTVLVGRNPPYGGGIAFWALGELLRAAAGTPPEASADEVRAALATRLDRDGAGHGEQTAATLATSLSGAREALDSTALGRAWRRLLAALAADRPLVIAVEDVHWADEGFLELLEQAITIPGCPLFVICTARPEIAAVRPDLGSAHRHERVELAPLGRAAAEELAAQLTGGAGLELTERIATTSAGNPFFAEEIAHALAEDAGADPTALPDTVQAAIAARIDALPDGEKRTLQLAAVLGERFSLDALDALAMGSSEPALGELERRRLIAARADEPGLYRFHHQLIRDVGYASLTRAERVDLHERAASNLRAGAEGRYTELGELIAFHVARAAELDGADRERAASAFSAVVEASELALGRGASARSQELLEQAARFAPDDRVAGGILADAADVALGRIRGDQAFRLYREAATRAERGGDRVRAARMLSRAVEVAARMAGISGRYTEPELEAMVARAWELVPEPDDELCTRLLLDEAWMSWRFDHPEGMAKAAAEAVDFARRTDDAALLSSALDAAGGAAWVEGRYADATAVSRERVELLEPLAAPAGFLSFERADAFSMLTESLVRAGEPRAALEWADANLVEVAETAPHVASTTGVQALYMLGEWDAALERSAGTRASWLAEGRPPFTFFAPALACVAAIHGIRGERPAEREWLEFAIEAVADNEFQGPGVGVWAADVALHNGDLARAIELLEPPRANRLTMTTSGWEDLILAKRAEALVLAGDPGAAEAVELVSSRTTADAHASAVALRARGLFERDDAVLAEACARFAAAELAPELARTEWLRGGSHRDRARDTFERLGAVSPG